MKQPSGRRWLVGAVGLFMMLLVVWFAAAIRISASAAAPSDLMSSLRSRLAANYAPDPAGSTVHSLRLSTFEQVLQDLGLSRDEAASHSREIEQQLQGSVPTATARDFEGASPLTATPTETPVPTETPTPTATSTRTPRPTATGTPKPTATKKPSGVDKTDPQICCLDLNPDPPTILNSCTFDVEELEVFDPAFSSGISASDVFMKYDGPSTGGWIMTALSLKSGGFTGGPGSDFSAIYDGTITLKSVYDGETISLKGMVTDKAGNGPVYKFIADYRMGTSCP
jgi:hypothetical protein